MKTLCLSVLVLAASGASGGCAEVQKPVRFTLAAQGNGALDETVRALAVSGHIAGSVDRQAGIILTQWRDTGFMYGSVQGATATIVRRYVLTVTPTSTGADLILRADTQRCAQGTFTVVDGGVLQGACEQLDGLVPKHQEEMDALGATLRGALGPAPRSQR